ncbi:MotA/TolQ/ExbB proton channel family protein [Solimonas sp. K1W22B-7]|uniref:MotA/TolQ/ExbB proton channel family protein n=1 Tax=Solimonas sp. K1W22B-7 TaxID=2303331 RepID=UPI000E335352|nr:MotA/TolQ/ExbB proton channel family protein [Solimonas sp. K1W22B-7]
MSSLKGLRTLTAALALAATALLPTALLAQEAPAAASEEAAASTAAPAPAASPATVTTDNPYGLKALWNGGDIVSKGTLAILVLMSAGSWFVIFTKLYEQTRLSRQGRKANASFWTADSVEQAVETLDADSAYHHIAKSGADATVRHKGLLGYIDLNDWIQLSIHRAIETVQSRLQGGLAFLATVGSTAPFVGLFGTVWGIYHALTAIGIAGQASIDKVAGPVGEALIMTAIGLAVAVPAVLGYNWLVRRNKAALESVRGFGGELHSVLLGAAAARAAQGHAPVKLVQHTPLQAAAAR